MANNEVVSAVVASSGFLLMVATAVELNKRRKRTKRSVWVKPWILTRPVRGAYNTLIHDLMNTDAAAYKNYTRMDVPAFEDLLSRVESVVCRQQTRFRPTICARERLCLTLRLRFLATGKHPKYGHTYFLASQWSIWLYSIWFRIYCYCAPA